MHLQSVTLIAFVTASVALAGGINIKGVIEGAKGASPAGHPAKGKTYIKTRSVHAHAFGGIPKTRLESRSPHGGRGGPGGRGGRGHGGGGYRHYQQQQQPSDSGFDGQGAVEARNYGGPRHGGHRQQERGLGELEIDELD